MHYIMSDLHGCYKEYIKMLELIKFSEEDILYINGDVVDRGDGPIRILQHMMRHKNIIPIVGNHELMVLQGLAARIGQHTSIDSQQESYFLETHKTTVQEFYSLSDEEQEAIVDYIANFSNYKEVKVNGQTYFINHAGFNWDDFAPDREMDTYDIFDLVWADTDYDKVYFPDKILVTGHAPTRAIDNEYAGRIIQKNNHMAIDCGCVFGLSLGCICLETGEEFYVKSSGNYRDAWDW